MWPDRVSNPGPLTYESGALPTALCGPAQGMGTYILCVTYLLIIMYLLEKFDQIYVINLRITVNRRFDF